MCVRDRAKAIDGLKAEIAEMQVQMKRAGEDREKQNKAHASGLQKRQKRRMKGLHGNMTGVEVNVDFSSHVW